MPIRHFEFLRESLRNIRHTGSIARSSPFLGRDISEKINPNIHKLVVELGPGDGAITGHILDRLSGDARLIILEINPIFVEKLQKKYANEPRITIIHDSAENLSGHLARLGIEKVDCFVSGIPFVMLPDTLAEKIVRLCREWLIPEGLYIQFHYSRMMLPLYKRVFRAVQIFWSPFNIPPALIMVCQP